MRHATKHLIHKLAQWYQWVISRIHNSGILPVREWPGDGLTGAPTMPVDIRTPEPPNTKKLQNLILYISRISQDDEAFGKTKLFKLLFFCDFSSYKRTHRPISDAPVYVKWKHGPVPKGIFTLLDHMVDYQKLAIQHCDFYGKDQEKPIALSEPDIAMFSAKEVDLINHWFHKFAHFTGTEISLESHKFFGWREAKMDEEIPYSLALLAKREPTEAEREYGMKLAQRRQSAM